MSRPNERSRGARPHERPAGRASNSVLLALADPIAVGPLAHAMQRAGLVSMLAFDAAELRTRLADRSLDIAVVLLDTRLGGDELAAMIRGQSRACVITLHEGRPPADPDALRLDAPAETIAARARVLAQRYGASRVDHVLTWGELRIVRTTRTAYAGRVPLPLTTSQFAVLRALVEAGGEVVDVERIAAAIYGRGHPLDNQRVRAHIVRLRRALRAVRPELANLLVTVRSEGYRLLPPDA